MPTYGVPSTAPHHRAAFIYLAVLLIVLVLGAGAATIWVAADNSATNVLSSDSQSTSPPAPLTAP